MKMEPAPASHDDGETKEDVSNIPSEAIEFQRRLDDTQQRVETDDGFRGVAQELTRTYLNALSQPDPTRPFIGGANPSADPRLSDVDQVRWAIMEDRAEHILGIDERTREFRERLRRQHRR